MTLFNTTTSSLLSSFASSIGSTSTSSSPALSIGSTSTSSQLNSTTTLESTSTLTSSQFSFVNCSYPHVDIHTPQTCINGTNCDSVYPNVLTNYRSLPLVLNSIVTYNCSVTLMANYNWSFSYYNASSQQWSNFTETLRQWYISMYSNDSSFWKNFNAYNLRNIIVPNHTMSYGLYQICLNVSMFGVYPVHHQNYLECIHLIMKIRLVSSII